MIARLTKWLKGEAGAADAVAAPGPQTSVLMVCMGNICRSPTAEGVLRSKLQRAGLQAVVRVDSAGTHGYHSGEAPDPRAIRHAAQRGYDISGLKARQVHADDFMRFDWLLAMDDENLAWLHKRAQPQGLARRALLMSFARHHGGLLEVPDPYYGGPAGFDRVLDLVEDACDGFLAQLTAPGALHRVEGQTKA